MKQSSNSRSRGRKTPGSAFNRALENAGDQITKRLTYSPASLATGAGTAIPVTQYSSSQVQSLPASEWASFAARYQQYRVRAIRVRGKATQPVQLATVSHSVLFQGDCIGSSTPGSAVQLFSDERVKETATYKDFSYVATWSRNPNAMLWNPTSAAIPVANTFSVVVGSATAPVLTTGTTYYAVMIEYDVEFRGSQ